MDLELALAMVKGMGMVFHEQEIQNHEMEGSLGYWTSANPKAPRGRPVALVGAIHRDHRDLGTQPLLPLHIKLLHAERMHQ